MRGRSTLDLDNRIAPYLRHTLTRDQQEARVRDALVEAYRRRTNLALENGRRPSADPPDWLFDCRESLVGAELFEVEQFHEERALQDTFEREAYREFDSRVTDDRYLGVYVGIEGGGVDFGRTGKFESVVAGKPVRVFPKMAQELVSLVVSNVSSREDLPNSDLGRRIAVDPVAYPLLSQLTKNVWCAKGLDNYPSPRRGLPLIHTTSGGVGYTRDTLTHALAAKLLEKCRKRARWVRVDHAMLVAHDMPRNRRVYLIGFEWEDHLAIAAKQVSLLSYFNELWLVPSTRGDGSPIGDYAANATRIVGRGLRRLQLESPTSES
jgi:hypothetical protein